MQKFVPPAPDLETFFFYIKTKILTKGIHVHYLSNLLLVIMKERMWNHEMCLKWNAPFCCKGVLTFCSLKKNNNKKQQLITKQRLLIMCLYKVIFDVFNYISSDECGWGFGPDRSTTLCEWIRGFLIQYFFLISCDIGTISSKQKAKKWLKFTTQLL